MNKTRYVLLILFLAQPIQWIYGQQYGYGRGYRPKERSFDARSIDSLTKKADDCEVNSLRLLIGFYKIEKKITELKRTLESAVKCPFSNYEEISFYLELADIYYTEGAYRNSLKMVAAVYKATKDKVNLPEKVAISFSGYSLAVKQGRCYAGLGLIDSAIHVLTPFMFYQPNFFMIHQHYNPSEEIYSSSGYNKVVGKYLSLLRNKYTDEEIKTELEKAKQSFYCDDSMSLEADSLGVKYRTVDCYFQFFNSKVEYLKTKIPDKIPKLPGKSSYDILPKGKPFQDFTETPLYRMIRDL